MKKPKDVVDEQEMTNARGGRKRAAAKAMGSLKEPSTSKKLRQGDALSTSIYTSKRLSNIREFSIVLKREDGKRGRKK